MEDRCLKNVHVFIGGKKEKKKEERGGGGGGGRGVGRVGEEEREGREVRDLWQEIPGGMFQTESTANSVWGRGSHEGEKILNTFIF